MCPKQLVRAIFLKVACMQKVKSLKFIEKGITFGLRNQHVRQITGIVMRAQRCKIKEIGLKYECLKFIGKMCYFRQPGAETIVFVTYFDQSHARENLQQQKSQIGAPWFSNSGSNFFIEKRTGLEPQQGVQVQGGQQ